ncbi:queuosine precursor transporter [Candidatus Berkiella aquae]|uniref:Queuosine precursor transporter n=1 Tax=Candidatus Berkiella aquae TaxID=295108 RepID=A0A0Q9YZX4_9GAMM|nr:queuosine precursor transporter [Candidatus Berkiella aquae]MCS5712472.1 queuosine precursor transporter [Candidatus Berkiella aquae]
MNGVWAMKNLLLFLGSCAVVSGFAWYFWRLGQSALTAWIALLSLLANLFVLKQIELFGFNATASDIFSVGNLLALNLLQEKYGRQATQHAIWASLSCLLFFVIISQIHLLYEPSLHDQSQTAYQLLLTASPRTMLASLVTFLIVDQFDSRAYRTFRQRLPNISMIWISGATMCLSQLLDTVLFSLLGLYGIVGALIEIILISCLIKLITIANIMPWSYISQRIFKKHAV